LLPVSETFRKSSDKFIYNSAILKKDGIGSVNIDLSFLIKPIIMKRKTTLLLMAAICFLNLTALCQSNDPIKAGEGIAVTSTDNGKVRGYVHNGILPLKESPMRKLTGLLHHANPKTGMTSGAP
jgi:hypothetical protein